MSLRLEQAKEFARRAHFGQMYGALPYEYHLTKVVGVLQMFGIKDEDTLIAAWLHDTIEDTETTLEHIKFLFGERVAALVWAVTDGEGKNRKEKKREMYEKVRATPGAVLLKLADRIANVDEATRTRSKHRYMYLAEHDGFAKELRIAPAWQSCPEREMWEALAVLIADIKGSV